MPRKRVAGGRFGREEKRLAVGSAAGRRVGRRRLSVVEGFSVDGFEKGRGSLLWNGAHVGHSAGAPGEGVGPRGEHALSQVGVVGMSGNAEVPQHGVRFPAPEELDHVGVHSSAEQGRGPTRAQAAGADQGRGDAGGVGKGGGGLAEGVRHHVGGDVATEASAVEVGVDRGVGTTLMEAKVVAETR